MSFRWLFILCILACTLFDIARAAAFPKAAEGDRVVVCPALPGASKPPNFLDARCQSMPLWDVDPQSSDIWVQTKLQLDETRGKEGEPLAIYVLGKMSSEVYLNGEFVGANGAPGPDRQAEIPGRMDAAFFPRQSLFQRGENDLIFRASSHHGIVKLSHPIHGVFADTAGSVTYGFLKHYWPAPLTLGIFLAGAIYFAIIGANGVGRTRALTICLICVFAAAQLLAEIARGLVAYPYPLHDFRLILITMFSGGFGLTVAFLVFNTFALTRIRAVLTGLALLSLTAVLMTPGFDSKAALAITIPMVGALIAAAMWTFQRRHRAFAYFLSLLVFLGAIFAFPQIFLDAVFFYLVAAFLLLSIC